MIGVIKAECPIVRERLGGTPGHRRTLGRRTVTSQMERKQEVQDERKITPCDKT